ncbi:hypothetical protein ATORI0001_0823 [Lancefieldella rimae ATCC 49626]|uniref:Uncharacterized protein n=1 Tax=Lancefieldella rimae (strain ATCC 49626 / DSM 7090 / CCUG 31168 / NBRC 15546 / VPI D140H-11A) TaxID=553184 RepID=B9CLA5_LANR4|nr:hypothetical protein ATORI0001_0823 [Lancefieldella rimae ATCC 49626]
MSTQTTLPGVSYQKISIFTEKYFDILHTSLTHCAYAQYLFLSAQERFFS